jgi:hypothetical protein
MDKNKNIKLFNKVLNLVDVEGKGWKESCIEVGVCMDGVEVFLKGMRVWMKESGWE